MIKVGQLWKDNDKRSKQERIVKVLAVNIITNRVDIQRVNADGTVWVNAGHGKKVVAPRVSTQADRFGKSGNRGFTLLQDAL